MKNITKQELADYVNLGFFARKKMFDDLGIKFLKFNNGFIEARQNASINRLIFPT